MLKRRLWMRWFGAMAVAGLAWAASGLVVSGSAPPGADPVGDAVAIAAGVELRPGATGAYVALAGTQAVSVGDGVRTDPTGFAEVAYGDGSRTRLDVETEFEVVALAGSAGSTTTRTEMGVGRTWHRVESLGAAGGGFEVVTSQATATVQGTAFLVSCLVVESCDYSVMEGVVDVTLPDGTVITVTAPATLDVTNGVATGPVPLSWDGLFGDPWLVANTDRDVTAGFADRATVYQAYGPAFASMVGTFEVDAPISAVECVSYCAEAVGDPRSFTTELTPLCGAGSCSFAGQAGVPYTFDGVTHRATTTPVGGFCFDDLNGDDIFDEGAEAVLATWSQSADFAFAPTAAAVIDGAFAVTEFIFHQVFTDDPEGVPCEEPDGTYMGATVTYDGTGTRVG